MTRILSIDPGYERVGVAILENDKRVLYSDCIQTSKQEAHPDRLLCLGQNLEKIIEKYRPNVLAIENLFFNTNQKTALAVSEARGLIIFLAKKNKMRVFEYTPPQIKVAVTGHGHSDKKQVINMTTRLIKCRENIKFDDEFDAIAVGLTCLASEKF